MGNSTEEHRGDTFRQAVDRRLAGLVLTEAMQADISTTIATSDSRPKKRRSSLVLRRAFAIAAAACLVLALGCSAAAAAFPSFESFLSRMGEDMRHLVHPVGIADVREGIRVEVLAAVNDGGSAVIYLSVNDEKAERVGPETELLSTEVSGPDSAGHLMCWGQMVDFDETSGAAIYRLEADGSESVSGQRVSLKVDGLLNGVEQYNHNTGVTLASIQRDNPSPALTEFNPTDEYGATGSFSMTWGEDQAVAEALDAAYQAGEVPLLQERSDLLAGQVDSLDIRGAGVLNDMLHVRFAALESGSLYGQTEFYLTWPGGPEEFYIRTHTMGELALGRETQKGYRHYYEEYEQILEIPRGIPAEQLTLAVGGTRYDEYIPATWQIAFQLEEKTSVLAASCDIDLKGWRVHDIEISSIGVTAFASGEHQEDSGFLEMEVWLADGTRVNTISGYGSSDSDGNIVSRDGFSRPIDISDVARLVVNGQELPFTLQQSKAA